MLNLNDGMKIYDELEIGCEVCFELEFDYSRYCNFEASGTLA